MTKQHEDPWVQKCGCAYGILDPAKACDVCRPIVLLKRGKTR